MKRLFSRRKYAYFIFILFLLPGWGIGQSCDDDFTFAFFHDGMIVMPGEIIPICPGEQTFRLDLQITSELPFNFDKFKWDLDNDITTSEVETDEPFLILGGEGNESLGNYTINVRAKLLVNGMTAIECDQEVAIQTLNIESNGLPVITILPLGPEINCNNQGVTLSLNTSNSDINLSEVRWFQGDTPLNPPSATKFVTTAGTYRIEYDWFCDIIVTSQREVTALSVPVAGIIPANNQEEFTSCLDLIELSGISSQSGNADPISSYAWSGPPGFDCSGDCNSPMITATIPGTYTLTITNSEGCTNAQSTTLTQANGLEVTTTVNPITFSNSDAIDFAFEFEPEISDASLLQSFIWMLNLDLTQNVQTSGLPLEGTGLETNFGMLNLLEKTQDGELVLDISGKYGLCDVVGQPIILISSLSESGPLLIPELISPNGDGVNDVWQIEGKDFEVNLSNYNLKLFDRSGCVIHTTTLDIPWDATNVLDGEYFYIIQNAQEPSDVYKGAVLVIGRQ